MAQPDEIPARAGRTPVRYGVILHGLAVVIFGLMTWRGIDLIRLGAEALGVPMLIAGGAGTAGALAILISVRRARPATGEADGSADPRRRPATGVQRTARLGMALGAAATVAVGVALAPTGWEQSFVISVNVVTGLLLGAFALLAGERRRTG